MTEQKVFPYLVALSFGEGGPLYVDATLAPSEVAAATIVSVRFVQASGTKEDVIGVAVGQLTPEFLRMALRAHEGTLDPAKPNIVSLVRETPTGFERVPIPLSDVPEAGDWDFAQRSDEPHRDAGWQSDPNNIHQRIDQ